ncbi:hypothetical protein DFH07DRAFT_862158 [Mycena maculata]|uniref:DUF6534 domain-containing protein n=1 Tax=Mycena maculata TaxID=230809 RepID=A0AAD7MGI9_9AGAR|nr:hypothetical protein DFH07DRAFT_862158 [Mycena maculata]
MSTTSLNTILGAVVLTGILGALFFGAACIQTYNYYRTYRSDGIILKGAVASLWAVDVLHIVIYIYTIWYYVVDALDTAWVPQVMNWSFKFSVWLAVALVLLLDILYMIYIFKLAPNYAVPALVGLTVAAGNIVAVVLGVRIIIFTHFTNIYAISSSALIYLFFGLFCLKAVNIAAAMTYYLHGSKDVFSVESNTSIVRRTIKLVVGSAMLIAFCSFFVLACHLAMPHSMSCVVVYMIVSKLYHNCFLSLLSCRPIPLGSQLQNKVDGGCNEWSAKELQDGGSSA